MKKFAIAAVIAACCAFTWSADGNVAQAAEAEALLQSTTPQVQQLSAWSRIRDKILDREDKHKHKHHNPPPPPPRHHDSYRRPAPPPPRHHDSYRHPAPPPRYDYRRPAPPPPRKDSKHDRYRYEQKHRSHGGHGPRW